MRPLLLLTALAGCLTPNPAYDPGEVGSAGGTGTTSAGTGGQGSTGGGVTGGESTHAASTSSGATATGAVSDSGTTGGDASTGVGCGGCKPCETCEGGQCVPLAEGEPCDVGEDLPCEQRIYGYVSEGCAVQKSLGVTQCDGAGACSFQCADAPGAIAFTCSDACHPEQDKCIHGKDVGSVAADDVCVYDGPSPACHDQCAEKMGSFQTVTQACDMNGLCAPAGPPIPCGLYVCTPDGLACETGCRSEQQCKEGHQCDVMNGGHCEP